MFSVSWLLMGLALISHADNTYAVFNGESVEEGEFKYVVALSNPRQQCTRPFCTGALITNMHVLTAGHCVHELPKKDIVVAAGIRNWDDNLFAEFRYVHKIHLHPMYRPGKPNVSLATICLLVTCQCFLGPPRWRLFSDNDIAVLEVKKSFTFSDTINQASLSMTYEKPRAGIQCKFAGWGISELTSNNPTNTCNHELRWSTYSIMDSDECERIKSGPLRRTEFCARHANKTSWTGDGDSGGVLVCEGGAVGVLQAGGKSGEHPSSYFMISHFLDFLDTVLESTISID